MNFLKHIPYTREFDTQTVKVKGNEIRQGDLIQVRGEQRRVTRVVAKVKNVEVYHSNEHSLGHAPTDPKANYRADQEYYVNRKFETDESKAIGLRHGTLEHLWHQADKATAARDAAKAKFDEQWASGHTGHWEYERLLVADMEAQVLQSWVKHVEQIAERVNVDGETWDNMPADALVVAENMAKRFQRDIMRNAQRPTSRSTAVMGNLVEDIVDSAKVAFVEYATGVDVWG